MQNRFHILCEYLGGHIWSGPLLTVDALDNKVIIIACLRCPSVRYPERESGQALIAA